MTHHSVPSTSHSHSHSHHHSTTSHHHQHHPRPPSNNHNHHHHHHDPFYNHQPLPSSSNNHNHNHRNRNQENHHYPHSSSSSSSASIRGCCCCLILLFSFLALLAITVVLVVVLAVKPKKPQFDLQQVAVQYINLAAPTNAPATTASLSLAVRMLFTAKNDNKVGIKYGVSTFNIMYRGIPLGRGTVPGFYQPAHSVRQVQTTVTVDRVNLMQADAADLVRDASLNDRVELRIMGDVNAKIRILGLTSPSVQSLQTLLPPPLVFFHPSLWQTSR